MGDFPTAADVLAAARRVEGRVRRTPLEPSPWLGGHVGTEVHLKLENLQRTGAFKLRGAVNALAALAPEARARGVVTASAGNHGMGVAWAARALGVPAHVFVPDTAAATKRRRIARFGAALREVPGGYDEAHHAAEEHARETGLPFVNAFSDFQVVAGQGTVGLEVLQELPGARTLVVPAGGGGLIGGIGVVARALGASVRVVGVQTDATSALHDSLAAGELRSPPVVPTLCEGLSGDIDARSLELARRVVDEVVLVSEDAVRRAIRHLYLEEGIVAEASAAVSVAALLEGAVPGLRGPVVAVLSGGNIDAALLAAILSE
ncbi:MAG TPA: pyridoxal-phosphate dependent enzyme [Longimicrobiaceae bacterium]|nr:pyridoxal-phosphate dependent enzyme [Longimicrobiaceae bacterium]